MIEFDLFSSCLGFFGAFLGPPGSGVCIFVLSGRFNSMDNLLGFFKGGLVRSALLSFTFVDVSGSGGAVLGLFLVTGLVSALPILAVVSTSGEAACTALVRELKVALKKFEANPRRADNDFELDCGCCSLMLLGTPGALCCITSSIFATKKDCDSHNPKSRTLKTLNTTRE